MSDVHLDLLKALRDYKYHTRLELAEIIPNASELTRRLRELRQPEWGNYTIRHDRRQGYILVGGVHPDERMQRRRKYLEEQAAL